MTARNQLAHATYNLIASQRPRRDARLLHDGGHGAVSVNHLNHGTPKNGDSFPSEVVHFETVESRCVNQSNSDTWEDARRRNASQRGYEYVAPNPIAQVWVDCELGRVSICRHELPEFRVWNYAHVAANGSGRILRNELYDSVIQLGLIANRSTFNGILARGNRLYWRERNGYLYLTSWKKLASKLTRWQAKYEPDHVATNRPGQRRVQLDLTGSLKLAHALIYNGWIAVKSEKLGYLEIARSTLSALWGRSKRQLLTWEKLVGIRTELRYAEHHDITAPLVPNYAYLCLDTDGVEFASWRLPNRFYAAPVNISETNGQRRRVRSACNDIVKVTEPVVYRADGQRRLQRTGKTTFTDRQGKNGTIPAFKQLDKHLRKHHDIFDRRHYAYIATRYGKHIFELSSGIQVRRGAGRDWIAEKSIEFQQRRNLYRLYWLDRGKAL